MKKTKNNNAITLLALVITIVIMLLLAAVAIQLTFGENGLIVKATKAKAEQAKTELYETAKLEYLNLKTKALEQGLSEPQAESVLSETNFLNKYNIVGDNITNKNNEVIETKENLLKELKKLSTKSDTPTIAAEDKDKLILKINVNETTNLEIIQFNAERQAKVEFHDGTVEKTKYEGYYGPSVTKTYNQGTYILKLSEFNNITGDSVWFIPSFVISLDPTKASMDIINWGRNPEHNLNITLKSVNKIYSPEPDHLSIKYDSAIFNKIPENLFVNKQHAINMSSFDNCNNITEIPENLFKNCVNAKYFSNTFYNCKNITSIPENLFKYNINATTFDSVFAESGITSIPENLFANNPNITAVNYLFRNCNHLSSIPENIISKCMSITPHFSVFAGCTSASNYSTIPAELK